MACRSFTHMLAAVLMLLCLTTGAAAAVQVRVTPAAPGGTVGSTITVTVEADSVTGLGGFQFGFGYSTSDLQAVAATINPAFDQAVSLDLGAATGSGMIAATVFDNSPVTGAPVTLATIDFKVLTPVTSALTLANVLLGQVGGTELPSTSLGATVAGSGADTIPPADGTLAATPGSGQNALSWSGFTDTGGSGIASYKLLFDTAGTPADCSSAVQIYTGAVTAFLHAGLTNGTPCYYRVCALDNAGNISTGATAAATPALPSFTVTFASGGNGSVSGTTQAITSGGSTTPVTATADGGYHFVNWTGTNGFVTTTINPLTVTNITADMTVTANFAPTVIIPLADTTAPVIESFTLPATSASLTVAITGFTASDATGIAGYLMTESIVQPAASDPNWTSTPSASITFSSPGVRILHGYAKDPAGNISGPAVATVTITLPAPAGPDTTAPVVMATAPADEAFDIATDRPITATFSEPMAATSINDATVRLRDSLDNPVAGSVGYNAQTGTATFTPSAGLSLLSRYTATISGAADLAGNVLPDYRWSFMTATGRGDGHLAPDDGRNGLTIVDALLVLRMAIGDITPTPNDLIHGDVAPILNGKSSPDGKIDIGDAVVILRKIVGLIAGW